MNSNSFCFSLEKSLCKNFSRLKTFSCLLKIIFSCSKNSFSFFKIRVFILQKSLFLFIHQKAFLSFKSFTSFFSASPIFVFLFSYKILHSFLSYFFKNSFFPAVTNFSMLIRRFFTAFPLFFRNPREISISELFNFHRPSPRYHHFKQ